MPTDTVPSRLDPTPLEREKEEIFKRQREKEAASDARPGAPCRSSTVQPSTTIVQNAIAHSGLITHRCHLSSAHEVVCECACGYRWVRNFR